MVCLRLYASRQRIPRKKLTANRFLEEVFLFDLTGIPRSELRFMILEPSADDVFYIENNVKEHDGIVPPIMNAYSLVLVDPVVEIWCSRIAIASRILGKGKDMRWRWLIHGGRHGCLREVPASKFRGGQDIPQLRQDNAWKGAEDNGVFR